MWDYEVYWKFFLDMHMAFNVSQTDRLSQNPPHFDPIENKLIQPFIAPRLWTVMYVISYICDKPLDKQTVM